MADLTAAPIKPRSRSFMRPAFVPWLFLLPALAIFSWFKFYPMMRGLWMSFFDVQFYADSEWIGLENFRRAFNDAELHAAVLNNAIYVVTSTLVSVVLALAIALALEGQARHLKIIRTAIFLPAVTSAAIVAEIWRIIFNPAPFGAVNTALGWVGIDPQGFLSDPNQALWTVILLHIWKSVPYDMVIFLAGLVGINRELYDAADVDGAGFWRKLWHVTLPGLIPAISVVVMLAFIRGFRVFAEVYATTGGGPAGRTEMIMTHVYKTGFEQSDYGYASAVSMLLLMFTVLLTVIHLGIKNRFSR